MGSNRTARNTLPRPFREGASEVYSLLETSPIGVGISRVSDYHIVYANNRLAEIMKTTRDDLITKPGRDNWVDLKQRQAFIDEFNRTGRVEEKEVQLWTRNSEPVWCLLSWETATFTEEECFVFWTYDISDQKEVEAQLRISEARFQDFADTASDWFWEMDENFAFTYFSARNEAVTGFGLEAFVGKTRQECTSSLLDTPAWKAHFATLEAHLPFRDFEYDLTLPNGEIHHVATHGNPVFDDQGHFAGYRGTGNDLTHLVKANAIIQKTQERLKSAVDSLQEGFALFDADDNLIAYNESYAAFNPGIEEAYKKGITFIELLRKTVASGLYPDAIGREQAYIQERMAHHKNPQGPIVQAWQDGTWHIIKETKTPEGGVALTYSDITELKSVENKLNLARISAEQANRAKSEFLGNMSHELRTPLNAIIGFSSILEQEVYGALGNEAYKEYAADIRQSGEYLMELLTDLLDISKIEAGEVNVEASAFDISDEIAECIKMVALKNNRVNLSLEVPDDLPLIFADAKHVRQILINLFSNALKFTPDGGTVTVAAHVNAGGDVVLSVADTGVGIAPEDIEKVITPFGQVADSMTRNHDGVGLGLSIVKSLVELNGGDLIVSSEVGVGTCVEITLPQHATRASS